MRGCRLLEVEMEKFSEKVRGNEAKTTRERAAVEDVVSGYYSTMQKEMTGKLEEFAFSNSVYNFIEAFVMMSSSHIMQYIHTHTAEL